MIGFWLFAAGGLGLRPANPEFSAQETQWELEEDISLLEWEEEYAEKEELPSLEEGDMDGDGYSLMEGDCDDSDASVYPGAFDIPQDGVDNDCDGVDAVATEDTCTYEIEMLCGPDGWDNRWILVETATESFMEQPEVCGQNEDSWAYYDSISFSVSTATGEELNLSICADVNCLTAIPHTDMGIDVYVNEILLVEERQIEDAWMLNHVCPW